MARSPRAKAPPVDLARSFSDGYGGGSQPQKHRFLDRHVFGRGGRRRGVRVHQRSFGRGCVKGGGFYHRCGEERHGHLFRHLRQVERHAHPPVGQVFHAPGGRPGIDRHAQRVTLLAGEADAEDGRLADLPFLP